MRKQPSSNRTVFVGGKIFSQLLSWLLVWSLAFSSLPTYSAMAPTAQWISLRAAHLEPQLRTARENRPIAEAAQPALMKSAMMAPPLMQATSPVSVFVAYADTSTPSLSFPTPWNNSPNTIFIGSGDPTNAGALRIDNPSGAPLTIDSVAVDLQRSNAQFNLWGSFSIPAGGSAILTQTQTGNFDTSAFPIVTCGGTLQSGETRIPQITITIAGQAQVFADTAHVLDTGGFDLSCRGNESLQWRQIGTKGIESPSGQITLSSSSSTGTGGSPLTMTAQVTDAGGAALPDVTVAFTILSGPNAGQSGQDVTDSQGNAQFTYTGNAQGADVIQASVANASSATVHSGQTVVTWQTASCGPGPTPTGAPSLIYIGATSGEFNDNVELAALLTDGTGATMSGRAITFTAGSQSLAATTDGNGVARVTLALASAPGTLPVSVNFAGDTTLPALQASGSINVSREETIIHYSGTSLISATSAQTLSATLLDPGSGAPIAGKTVSFQIGATTATAVTNAQGVASAAITLGPAQITGPSALVIAFAGDTFYKPSLRTIPITLFSPAGFVVWGGNSGGLAIGQRVNFWGSQWESQIINGQYFGANPSFKGWSGSLSPIGPCEVNVTPSTLDTQCWQVKPGESFPPSAPLPDYIEVVISTVINKSGSTVFGNIACGAVVKVDHTPPYGSVPGQPGFGAIVGPIDGNCSGIFPPPASLTATQTQPVTVLPNQQITVTTTVTNSSTATAATGVTVNENLDGLTPATASLNLGSVAAGTSQSGSFQATVPNIPIRQSSESATDYIQRLSALNGRFFTVSGQVSFTDAQQQNYLPLDVSSQSILEIPILTLSLSGPSTLSPGANAIYLVTATNIGSAAAASTAVSVTLPDGSLHSFTVPTIAAGSSFTQPVSFTPAALAPKGANETTDQYLGRLAAADGQIFTVTADVNWNDAAGNSYGDVGQEMFSSALRVPVLELTPQPPATLLPSQTATLNFTVQNTGGCTAASANLQVTNPDSTFATAPPFPLGAGQSTSTQTTWHVTSVPGKQGSETDAAYLARLTAANNSALSFQDSLGWSDPTGASYGPTSGSFQSKKVLPIVTVSLSAPSAVQAGNTIGYTVMASNVGAAIAPSVTLNVTLPDGTVQSPSVGSLAPGATFQTTINFLVPATQAAGVISAQATVFWTDAVQNGYGSLSSAAQTTVTNPQQFNSLVLTPAIAGPDVTGTSQTLTATLKDSTNTPIANASVQFTVTGVNPTSGTATTSAAGVATFSYSGAQKGNDQVQATSGTAVSNTATVSWITPVQIISTATIFGRFFTSDGSGGFNTPPTATPAFTQTFPTINFNPPAGTIPGNTSGVGVNTRPFTDVTTDLNGNFTGTIVAQGHELQAGVNTLFTFQAVFTSTLTVANAGDVVLSFFSDDGFIFGVGGGATRVSGPLLNVPAGGVTPFESLPVMGAFNSATAPIANTIVVHFPAPGTYPYELDYTECCAGQEALTMAVGQANSKGVPPTGSLVLSPNNPPTLAAGQTQTFTVQASDASGLPVPNAGIALIINGANQQQLSASSDTNGRATFSYSAVNAGTDSLQAVTNIGGLGAFSNLVNVNWTVPAGGGGTGGTITFVPQGWIGGPAIGTVVQGQVPITVASGISLTSGVLEYWPTANPSDVHILNGNVTGSGTIGTFDGTTLASGGYTVQLQATASNGTQQTSVIVLSVLGDSKPGRVAISAVDLKLPLAGIPISITRSYDSLKRDTVQDFGFGWSLATTVDLQVDAANNVSFTVNGQRGTFFFQAQPSSFLFPWLLIPSYVPQPGLHGTLTSDGCGALIQVQGTQVCFPSGPYQPTTYTYTDPTGRVYVIAANGQIKSIKDLNGNVLTFGPDGITSSVAGGVNIPFTRDGQGRITGITDLNNNSYTYGYDGSGNLASVSLPGVPVPAAYTYDSTHLLTGQTDFRGNSTTTQYFSDGRLKSVTDSMGNTTSFAYTLNSNGTTTTTTTFPDTGVQVRTDNNFGNPLSILDPLKRLTTYTYDTHQNVLTRTDPLGKITRYTYDANGFQTSVEDPLLHTTTKVYNQFGGITSETDALNSNTVTIAYDANLNPVQWTDQLGQVQAATYDAAGNMLSRTNGNNKTTNFTYDARGNLTQISAPLNQTTSYAYDAMDRVVSQTDARQKTTTFQYDALGRLSDRIDPVHGDAHFVYDGNNNKISQTDPLGNTTTYGYDNRNNLSSIQYPDSTTRQTTYDFRGNKLTDTDQLGRVTTYAYDLAGQLTSVTYASGTADAATIRYTYDLDGRKLTETDGRGNATSYGYDDAGRQITMTDALNKVTAYGYDADNRRTSMKDANQHNTSFAYDVRGRLHTVTYNDLSTAAYTYDNNGNQITSADQAGLTTHKGYDDLNRLISVTDASNAITQYGYDPNNNLVSITDANGHATSFQYDNLNRRTLRQLPLGMAETGAYDAVGNLLSKTDFNGRTTTYTYDSLNRLLSKTPDPGLNEAPVSFTYTGTGMRASMQDASGSTTYKYDNRDQLISKKSPQGTLTYTYDGAGNALTIVSSNPNGASLSYTYDADDRLATVTDKSLLAHGAVSAVTAYAYDPVSNLSAYTYPNAIQSSYIYDTLNRLTRMQSTCGTVPGCGAPNTVLASFSYTLGAAGNRTQAVEPNGRNVGFQYDNDYRLTMEAISGASSQNGTIAYTYDPTGNRTQRSSTVPAIPASGTLSYDANDRSASDPYDANGNLLSSGTGTNVYDFEDRLAQDGAVSVVYDGDGNRVSETAGGVTTSYLVDTQNLTGVPQVLDESINGSVSRTYAYGLQLISQNQLIGGVWTPSFYGFDGHGSVRFLANAGASVTDTYDYDAFGTLIAGTGSTPNNYLFSGEQFDGALGLYQLRARWYRPATGRFLSRDPVEGDRTQPLTLNSYLYTVDDPVNRTDPTGQDAAEYALTLQPAVRATPAIIALGIAVACLFTLSATTLEALVENGPGTRLERTGPCTVKGTPTCKSEYPNLIPVDALFGGYPFESEGEAFAALQAAYPGQPLRKATRAPATGGPCPVGGQYDPGWHINVRFAKGNGYAGSLVGCPCCDDSSGVPEPTQRWGVR